MILTPIKKRVQRWLDRIVHQAIIDGADLYRVYRLRNYPIPEIPRRPAIGEKLVIQLIQIAIMVLIAIGLLVAMANAPQ